MLARSLSSLLALPLVLMLFAAPSQALQQPGPPRAAGAAPERKVNIHPGPGLGNLHYAEDELFQPVGLLRSPVGHGNGLFVNGYFLTVYSTDGSSFDNGGIDVWDLSNPRSPKLMRRYDDDVTHQLRESHGIGLARIDGRDVACLQSLTGLQFWDFSDPLALRMLRAFDLPGINGGNYEGVWWVFWQAPYVYAAGTHAGLYIVDARDPEAPQLVRRMSPSELGGLSVGQAVVQGNLMVANEHTRDDIRTLDASDPTDPRLLVSIAPYEGYSQLFTGGRLYTVGNGNDEPRSLSLHDVGHDGSLTFVSIAPVHPGVGNGAYATKQDGYVFAGFSNQFLKCDADTLEVVGEGTSGIPVRDEDFAVVLGNIVFVGNDHGQGSALIPHQRGRDRTPPAVDWVHPADGATGLASTTRVGLSLSDMIDLDSVDERSFQVRGPGGDLLRGVYSLQFGIVNFSPDVPLVPGTHTVRVEGVQDLVGNRSALFTSSFEVGGTGGDPMGAPRFDVAALAPAEVGQPATFDVENVTGGTPMTFTWDFGDGQISTTSASSQATHAYTAPGRYSVVVTATNASGSTLASAQQIVHRPLLAARSVATSSVVAVGATAYCVNPDNGTVTAVAIDGADAGDKLWEAPVAGEPRSLALAPGGRLWVACRGTSTGSRGADASIHVLDRGTGATVTTLPLPRGSRPQGVLLRPDGTGGYVSLEGSRRVLRLGRSGELQAEVSLPGPPRGLALTADGTKLLVTRFLSPADRGEIFELNAFTLVVQRTLQLPFDPGPDTEASGRGVPNYLSAIALAPDGGRAVVPGQKANVARGTYRDGQPLTFESRTRTMVAFLDLVAGTEDMGLRVDLDDRCLAQSALYSPLGDLVFVGVEASNSIEVLDSETGEPVASWVAGAAPLGFALEGGRLCVHNFLSRSLTVLDVRDVLAARDTVADLVAEVDLVATEALAPEVLLGKRIFYDATDPRMNQDGYLTCAACHLDGGDDGQVWDLTHSGQGLRNTIPLTGRAGTYHGRLHWSANFDEIQDFETDIREEFDGDGFMGNGQYQAHPNPLGIPRAGVSDYLDALAAYVATLDAFPPSPYRNANGQLTPDAIAGLTVFQNLQCTSCHTPPRYTDLQTHDVGTILPSSGPLSGVDTPTLRGLWLSPPYLHDGRAATLYELQHGGMAGLTPTERDRLVAYLLQLE